MRAAQPGSSTRELERWVDLHCVRPTALGRVSPRTAEVAARFGLAPPPEESLIVGRVRIPLRRGQIVLLLGPSGAGKSSALERVEAHFAGGIQVQSVAFPPYAALLDGIAPWATLGEVLSLLTACGLGEPAVWMRPFEALSEGEKFRARLARALALHGRSTSPAPLLCDEFCSTLHPRAARAVSYNLRRVITRRRLSAVLAAGREDILPDLQPDVVVRLDRQARATVEHRAVQRGRPLSLRRRLRIEPGSKRDYEAFAEMHYRGGEGLGFVDRVFVLREGRGGEAVGIVVYAHGALELALRNRATEGRFVRDPQALNQQLRTLRRLVIHPDLRGCGLGRCLVQRTLPRVGTEYVECLATMGELNPVFERAGMRRVGQYEVSAACQSAMEALRAMDVDPADRTFADVVARRRAVRAIVSGVVRDWYAATTGGGERRVGRQSAGWLAQTFRGLVGLRPVYYLWQRGRSMASRRESRKSESVNDMAPITSKSPARSLVEGSRSTAGAKGERARDPRVGNVRRQKDIDPSRPKRPRRDHSPDRASGDDP